MYGIQIMFGHDKDYSDTARIKGLDYKSIRAHAQTEPYGKDYNTVRYRTVTLYNIHV